MTETSIPAATAPATAIYTDAQLLAEIERRLRTAREWLAAWQADAATASPTYLAQWSIETAVAKEVHVDVLSTAVAAAAKGEMREALAYKLGTIAGDGSTYGDPFAAATAAVRRKAARQLLACFRTEVDAAAVLEHLT